MRGHVDSCPHAELAAAVVDEIVLARAGVMVTCYGQVGGGAAAVLGGCGCLGEGSLGEAIGV